MGNDCNEEKICRKWKRYARQRMGFCDGLLCDCFVVNFFVCMNALHGFIGREWMGEHVNGS